MVSKLWIPKMGDLVDKQVDVQTYVYLNLGSLRKPSTLLLQKFRCRPFTRPLHRLWSANPSTFRFLYWVRPPVSGDLTRLLEPSDTSETGRTGYLRLFRIKVRRRNILSLPSVKLVRLSGFGKTQEETYWTECLGDELLFYKGRFLRYVRGLSTTNTISEVCPLTRRILEELLRLLLISPVSYSLTSRSPLRTWSTTFFVSYTLIFLRSRWGRNDTP